MFTSKKILLLYKHTNWLIVWWVFEYVQCRKWSAVFYNNTVIVGINSKLPVYISFAYSQLLLITQIVV